MDVRVKIVIANLVAGGAEAAAAGGSGELAALFGSVDPQTTILRDIATSGRDMTQDDALTVLSQLPAVVGLTPAYTPEAVRMILAAKLIRAFNPFA